VRVSNHMAKKELRRIKVNFDVEQLELINGLTGTEEWDIPFSIKIEKLIDIALAYRNCWEEDQVFKVIKGELVVDEQ